MFLQGFHERSQRCFNLDVYYTLSIFNVFKITYVLVVLQPHEECIYIFDLILTTVLFTTCLYSTLRYKHFIIR